jgi:hypothetical protein
MSFIGLVADAENSIHRLSVNLHYRACADVT